MNSFPVIDPASGAKVGEYPATTRREAHQIVEQVHGAFLARERTTMPERVAVMHAAAETLRCR